MPYSESQAGTFLNGRTRYVDQQLMPGEHVIYAASLHWIIFLRSFMWFAVGALLIPLAAGLATIAFIMAAWSFISALVRLLTSEFVITNKRLFVKDGFIRRTSLEILLSKIEGVSIDQGVLGRIVDSGTLIINGIGGSKQAFRSISRPFHFRRSATMQIEQTH